MNRTPKLETLTFIVVLVAALFSGAAALSYEVVWSRMLVIPLGNAADANALVLAAFMLGIALGALLLGRVADRVRYPLRLYAVLEIILGLLALVMPGLIAGLDNFETLRGSLSERPMAAVGRLMAAGALILGPSLLMGATLPVLVRGLARKVEEIRRRVGLIYGANTLGAASGAALAGFLLVPLFGFYLTSTMAALCNFAAALLVLGVRRIAGETPAEVEADEPVPADLPDALQRSGAAVALLVAAVSGYAMLSSEVLWARLLTFVFGHDTYAFATLLAVVLAGLGIGGVLHRLLARGNRLLVCGALTGLLALSVAVSYWGAAAVVVALGRDPFDLGASGALAASLRLEFYREIFYTPLLVLLPAVVSGTLFPAACALYVGSVSRAGARVGTVTLVNGVASAAGSILTSFVLVSWLGIQGALVAAVAVAAGAAVLIAALHLRWASPKRAAFLFAPPLLAAAVVLAMPAALPRAMLLEAVGARHQKLLHYEEGRTGTVSVTRNVINQEKQLFMNAVNEVTTRLVHDQSFKLLGHLGPLLHPKPEEGLMICLGAGLSAGAALVHPLSSLDVVELSSSIPKAAALWGKENNHVLQDPRFRLHIADGRHYLLSTTRKFDVLMVDSTHPKAVDSWILYTREFYELMRDRLREDGIAVQWVPLHGLSETEFKIIVRTFYEVFPNATLWVNVGFEVYGQAAYLKMVGTKSPLLIDYKELALRLKEPRIAADLKPFGMASPEEILDSYLAGPRAIDAWTRGLPVQTDDRPIVPYTTSYSNGRRMEAPLLLGVRSPVELVLRNMGQEEAGIRKGLKVAADAQGFLLAGMLERAAETWPEGEKIKLFQKRLATGRGYYRALAEKYADEPEKLFEIGSLVGNLGYPEDARHLYEQAYKVHPDDPRYRINLALTLLDLGKTERAVSLLRNTVRDHPDNPLALYNLGVALIRSEDAGDSVPHLTRAVALLPELPGAHLALANAYLELGQLKNAEAVLLETTESNPFVAEAWDMLGLIAQRRKDWARAKGYHIRALSLEPYRAASHYNLGIALEGDGRLREAAQAYQTAVRIEPSDAEAQNNLGLVYAGARLFELAAECHRKALDIEPHYPEAAYNLGLAYAAMGQTLPAAEAFGLALKMDPDLKQAKEQLDKLQIQVEIQVDGGVPDGGAEQPAP